MNPTDKTLIVITGPTASGKSALAVKIASHFNTDIISADSRQIYRHIPILTAVPPEEEKGGIKHKLIECLELDEPFSASDFEREALSAVMETLRYNNTAVLCGGSMFYIQALCNGMDILPDIPEEIRETFNMRLRTEGLDSLVNELCKIDTEAASIIDLRNPRRVIHALETSFVAGIPYSRLIGKRKVSRPFRILNIVLDMPREILFDRINRRVDKMILQGGLKEAKDVYPMRGYKSLHTVGFNELFAYFDGLTDIESAISRIKKNTRVFAKKQLTWIKKQYTAGTLMLDATNPSLHKEAITAITEYLRD